MSLIPECVWEAGLSGHRPPPGHLSGQRCWIWGTAAGRYRAESARKFPEAHLEEPYGPHPPHLCLWCYSPERKLLERERERDLWFCVREKQGKNMRRTLMGENTGRDKMTRRYLFLMRSNLKGHDDSCRCSKVEETYANELWCDYQCKLRKRWSAPVRQDGEINAI